MRVLVAALLAFILLLVAQVVVWRIWRPAGHYQALSLLYLVVLAVSAGVFSILGPALPLSAWIVPASLRDCVDFVMLFTAGTLAYMVTYSAVQADSPSMAILLQIEAAGAEGLGRSEITAALNDQVLVLPRLQDLVIGKLVAVHRERYVISARGALLARIYVSYRALLKMQKGG